MNALVRIGKMWTRCQCEARFRQNGHAGERGGSRGKSEKRTARKAATSLWIHLRMHSRHSLRPFGDGREQLRMQQGDETYSRTKLEQGEEGVPYPKLSLKRRENKR